MPQSKNGNSAGGMATFEDRLAQNLQKAQAAAKQAAPPIEQSAPVDPFQERLRTAMSRANGGGDDESSGVNSGHDGTSDTAEPASAVSGPVGDGEHVVRQGECVSSIAKNVGHFWETIWNDAANAELREIRKDPNVLLPEDRIHVPPLRPKQEPGQTEMRHRFRRKGQPEILRIRVLCDDEPRGNEPYEIDVDGEKRAGVTDADGKVVCPIQPNARRALLRVGTEDVQEFVFDLGELDPIDELSGVQGRLCNLGFDCWSRDGELSEETDAAIRLFQRRHGLVETGEPDEATRAKLQSEYGC